MAKRPEASSVLEEKTFDSMEEGFKSTETQMKSLTIDEMNKAPKLETEPQTKISQKDLEKSKEIYLKPVKTIGSAGQKFNEKFREAWEFDKQYVKFIAENLESIGSTIEIWTRPYGGVNAEFWQVPCNKPVWGPRYLAEQIKGRYYHRMKTEEKVITSSDGLGTYHGSITATHQVQRLDAKPVSNRKSVFMGAD